MTPDPPTGSNWDSDAGNDLQVVRASARQRRVDRRNRRLTVVATLLTVVFAAALVSLLYGGWRSTLRVTGGRDQEVTDPAAPGYTAEAKLTPVQLVAVTDGAGQLASILLFIKGHDDAPVTVVPISSSLVVWEYEDASPVRLADLYADGGVDVMALRLGVDLTFGVTSFVEVPFATFDPLVQQIGDLTIELADNVYGLDENGDKFIKYSAGPLTLKPSEVPEFLSFQGLSEVEVSRSMRSRSVWTQILDKVTESETSLDLPDAVVHGAPLLAELRGAGEESYSTDLLPTKEIPLNASPPVVLDRVDADSMTAWVTQNVPFPTSAYPGQRWVVSLLNGTTDKNVIRAVAPRLVAAGGSVGMTGNGKSFDIAKSVVEYTDEGAKLAAEKIAAQLGVKPTRVELMPAGIDVTVIVGKDLL